MARPFSIDLRERVGDAVVRGGLSCRKTAARFGVGVSTAIAWVALFPGDRPRGARADGGHRPKKLIGPWREWLLARCRERDFTPRAD
jgi:transposase